mmetsp:Transcript_94489/g.266915  ORF Transcript_94489/g.266915 Transcript_94489/m.266915 type:complete len:87 (+) Transcript_94489:675-935(+)
MVADSGMDDPEGVAEGTKAHMFFGSLDRSILSLYQAMTGIGFARGPALHRVCEALATLATLATAAGAAGDHHRAPGSRCADTETRF